MDHDNMMSMDIESTKEKERPTCLYCKTTFSKLGNKNKHIRNVHQEEIEDNKECRILCPVCPHEDQLPLRTYNNLYKHAEEKHGVGIYEIIYNFSSKEEYEDWKKREKFEVCYTLCRKISKSNCSEIHYACNRSNTNDYQSNCKQRREKSGGSIKINGICPSRLIVTDHKNGEIVVRYQRTHLGHSENELRTRHLSDMEKNTIVEKLRLGIPTDRILEYARKLESDSLQRINVLNKNDINYLRIKHNIDKKSYEDQMVAVVLIDECSANEQDCSFIVKQAMEKEEELESETNQNEITQFIDDEDDADKETKRNAEIEDMGNFLRSLNKDEYTDAMGKIKSMRNEIENTISRKRKRNNKLTI